MYAVFTYWEHIFRLFSGWVWGTELQQPLLSLAVGSRAIHFSKITLTMWVTMAATSSVCTGLGMLNTRVCSAGQRTTVLECTDKYAIEPWACRKAVPSQVHPEGQISASENYWHSTLYQPHSVLAKSARAFTWSFIVDLELFTMNNTDTLHSCSS